MRYGSLAKTIAGFRAKPMAKAKNGFAMLPKWEEASVSQASSMISKHTVELLPRNPWYPPTSCQSPTLLLVPPVTNPSQLQDDAETNDPQPAALKESRHKSTKLPLNALQY
jgi:hypothetical protein